MEVGEPFLQELSPYFPRQACSHPAKEHWVKLFPERLMPVQGLWAHADKIQELFPWFLVSQPAGFALLQPQAEGLGHCCIPAPLPEPLGQLGPGALLCWGCTTSAGNNLTKLYSFCGSNEKEGKPQKAPFVSHLTVFPCPHTCSA